MNIPQSAHEFDIHAALTLKRARDAYQTLLADGPNMQSVEVLKTYDHLFIVIEQVSAPASLYSNVSPDDELRKKAEEFEQAAHQLYTEISLDKKLFELINAQDVSTCSEIEQRLHSHIVRDYKRSGVDKDDATRTKITSLNAELIEIGQEFERNIREDVRSIKLKSADLAGLPGDFCDAHAVDSDGFVTITTDYPDYRPFMIYAENSAARKELFIKFHSRAYPKNESVLNALIGHRQELASLLGYASWADYVMEDKMIKTSDAVQKFIDTVDGQARQAAQKEYDALLAEKRLAELDADSVEEFEKSFWEERVKRRNFNFDSLAVRAYFEYNKVQDGLLALTEELFGISYRRVENALVWHASVDVFDVFRGEKNIGRIYLDMHPRDNKYKHAAQFTLQSGVNGSQLPEGVLVCNFSDPSVSAPALMDHDQVTTFFHEFGHLLHHVLGGAQEFIYFSGVATERDFVEAPSQFFEEWAMDAATLQRFAHHVETQDPIPTELVERMRAADEFGKGLFVRRQMVFAALSLHCYNQQSSESKISVHDIGVQDQMKYGQFPHTEGTYHECSFGHLDGYSAIYYTYMWSLVIAKDLLSKFPDHDMMNEAQTRAYAQAVLEPGGSKDAAELVKDFLGREYSFDAFNNWLTK